MKFEFDIFYNAIFSMAYLKGAGISLALATSCQILAVLLGFLLTLLRVGKNPILSAMSATYIWFFRAIPALLLLMIFWFSIPEVIPAFRQKWYSPFIAAMLGFAVLEAAYMAEILRSALISVDEGQSLAARALGMTPNQVMRKVTLPQLIRIAIPPTANEYIGMIKYTSLASVISLQELLNTAGNGVNKTFRYSEYYAAAGVYYLVIVSVLMFIQSRIERKFAWISISKKDSMRAKR